jgi:hypothetical protein
MTEQDHTTGKIVTGPLHIGDATESIAGAADSVKALCDAILAGGLMVENHLETPWGVIALTTTITIRK